MINSPEPFFFPPLTKPRANLRRAVALALLLTAACAAAARGQQAHKIDETDYARRDLSEVPQLTDAPRPIFVDGARSDWSHAELWLIPPAAGAR